MVALNGGNGEISVEAFTGAGSSAPDPAVDVPVGGTLSLREQVDALERSIIARTLAAVSGNQSEAARQLGLSRSSLIDRLKKYGFAGSDAQP
jgi:two-component system response regulator AtoC